MSDPNESDGITPDHLAVCEGMRRAWQRERPTAERDLLEISLDGDIEEPATVDPAEATSQESQRDVRCADTSAEDPESEVVLTLQRPEAAEHLAISQETTGKIDGAGKQSDGPIQQGNAVASELATLSLEAERQEEERLREEALRSRERRSEPTPLRSESQPHKDCRRPERAIRRTTARIDETAERTNQRSFTADKAPVRKFSGCAATSRPRRAVTLATRSISTNAKRTVSSSETHRCRKQSQPHQRLMTGDHRGCAR
ncbi:unnamed protein product [Trichogramma brassicae]|uniref:Uncharacterized protein n=1 Tax=Trichogramma brassicae TaxID=86971 RepID=A0A6H5J4V4_9HYME|nr:unnamed protein product [Trichogramma brassicae]